MQDENSPLIADVLDDETIKGLESQANHKSRLQNYAKAKARSVAMAEYIKTVVEKTTVTEKLHYDLNTCGEYLVFRDYYTIGQIKLSGMCSCKKHLLCPLCAIRRGGKAVKKYLERLQVIRQEKPDLQPYLITLTVKDGDNLLERFRHLEKSVKRYHRLRRDALCLSGRRPVEANKADGAVWSYEVKRGKNSGAWHPHMHAIWLCSSPPNQTALAREWRSLPLRQLRNTA